MSRGNVIAGVVGAAMTVSLGGAHLTRPEVIVGWVDVRHWDPTVLVFMVGAVGAYGLLHRFAAPACPAPGKRPIDTGLMVGSAIFGVGWGLGGVCPAPALASLGAGASWALPFIVAMVVGLWLGAPERLGRWLAPSAPAAPSRASETPTPAPVTPTPGA